MNNTCAEELYDLYVTQGKTMKDISVELGIAVGKIHRLIHEYGIPTKKTTDYEVTEAQREAWRNIGKSHKGCKRSSETRHKISESRKIHGMGHRKKRSDGYIALYYPDYPHSNKDGYIMEHVYVMEQHIGRLLKDDECVHHKNFDRADNGIGNLQLMTKSEHMSYHMTLRHAKGGENN